MRRDKKQEIEYEDAPSGYVTFYNYKEPLMKYKKGYGYVGTLLFDGESDKVLCSICGQWFSYLVPHLSKIHNMNASQYKNELGLLQTTALLGEKARAKLIASGLDKRLQNLRKGHKKSKAEREKIRATLKANAFKSEQLNLKGTCPVQIIERMRAIAKKQGNLLRMRHFDNMRCSIIRTYGSIKEACKVAGINYRKPSHTLKNEIKSNLSSEIKRFYEINNRFPSVSDCKRGLIQSFDTYNSNFTLFKSELRKIKKEINDR